jgi:Na+/H+ antiporter NhaD/arsenite permease-like protein
MRTLSVPVLSVIPYMERREDRRRRLRRRWLIFAGLVLAAVAGLAVIHFYFMPLEVLWFSLLRRLHLD